ncbi:hypothetical protein C0995_007158 [Termitomyces sp. Mi166|nr:hypothetical protein C0995_007158 [Termitomyces sp. Mi166\
MGRRKIEIQPITRKNGLFKKAYELGVLCSVDVAVIVFGGLHWSINNKRVLLTLKLNLHEKIEERPGHHVKLFQYCSTDVQSIIQRHIRHDGERDTRGPADFAPGAATKVEEADVDIIEDEDDDEEGGPALSNRGSTKRRGEGLHLDTDYIHSRSLGSPHSFPPNPAASMIQRQQGFPQRTSQHIPQRHYEQDNRPLHLTTDRHQLSPVQSKRPRLGAESPHTPTLGMYNNTQFRIPGHPSSLTSSHGHIQAQQSSYQEYPPFSASPSSSHSFPSLHTGSSRDRATTASDRTISGMTGVRAVYGSIAASTSPSVRGPESFGFMSGADDGRRRSATASNAGSGLGLDWPSSKPGPMAQSTERDRRSETEGERPVERTASGSSGGANPGSGTGATGAGGSGWLDFLSGNGTAGTHTGVASTSPGGLSWERGSSNRTRTGGGTGSDEGSGEIDGLSLFGLNSGETKKEGG